MTHVRNRASSAMRLLPLSIVLSVSLFFSLLSLRSNAQCTLTASASVSTTPGNQYGEVTLSSAPGGDYTFASGGSAPGSAPGRTWMISNVHGPWTDIAWTISQALLSNPRHSSQSPTGQMVFDNYNPGTGIATFVSSAPLVYQSVSGTESVNTRLRVQFQPYTGIATGPLASGFITPVTASSLGITTLPANWPLVDIPSSNSFQVWFALETDNVFAHHSR